MEVAAIVVLGVIVILGLGLKYLNDKRRSRIDMINAAGNLVFGRKKQ